MAILFNLVKNGACVYEGGINYHSKQRDISLAGMKLYQHELDIEPLKGHCIEFKYYADGIHSGLTPPG